MTSTEPSRTSSLPASTSDAYPSPPLDGVIHGLMEDERNDCVVILQCLVLLSLWLSAVFGNVLVCVVIQRSRRVQSTTNYFIKSMAYSDIVLVLVTSPVVCAQSISGEWELGHIMCRLVRFLELSSMACTAFILMAICCDRYYTIIYPLSFKVTRGTAKRMIVASWITAAVTSSLAIYVFDEIHVPRYPMTNSIDVRRICPTFIPVRHWTGQIYACVLVLGHFLCPVLTIAVGYLRVMRYIHQTKIKAQFRKSSTVVPRNKVKMVKTLVILTISTLLFYSPYFIVQLFHCFNDRTLLSPNIFISAYTLISVSAAMKPVLYACRNSNFLRGCKEMLCMSGMKCYRLNTYTITTASRLGKKNFIGIMDLSREQINTSLSSADIPMCRADVKSNSPWSLNGTSPSTPF